MDEDDGLAEVSLALVMTSSSSHQPRTQNLLIASTRTKDLQVSECG